MQKKYLYCKTINTKTRCYLYFLVKSKTYATSYRNDSQQFTDLKSQKNI